MMPKKTNLTVRQSLWRRIQNHLIKLPYPWRQRIESARWLRLKLRREHYWFERDCRQEFFRRAFVALGFNKIDGDYMEFGCHGGMTFNLAYHESRRVGNQCLLWGVDSFLGLPDQEGEEDEHPAWIAGTMHTGLDEFHFLCRYNGIPREVYRVIPGYYDQTLSDGASEQELPNNICLAYIDCDLYSSTVTVLNFLRPRLKHGMILAFDDYYCWSNTQVSGERRALMEFLSDNVDWRLVPYVQYGWNGMSFVVERRNMPDSTFSAY